MQNLKYGFGLAVLLLTTACSHSKPGDTRFTKYAVTLPPITAPQGIKNPTAESYYPIPPVAQTTPFGVAPPLTPPGSQLVPQKSKTQLPAPT